MKLATKHAKRPDFHKSKQKYIDSLNKRATCATTTIDYTETYDQTRIRTGRAKRSLMMFFYKRLYTNKILNNRTHNYKILIFTTVNLVNWELSQDVSSVK